jgi:hypothetical protein
MSVNFFNTFLLVMAFVIHGIKYWPAEIFHVQDLVSFYLVLIIMPDIRLNFITVKFFMILRKELNAIFFARELKAIFMTVIIFVINAILAVNLPCPFGDSYRSSMFLLSESNCVVSMITIPVSTSRVVVKLTLLSDLSCQNNWPSEWKYSQVTWIV